MVHQHFMLFPSLTIVDNVIYGSEPRHRGLIDRAAARRRVSELAERHGLEVDPDRRVSGLPVGIQQRIEILKALYREADLLILDEPTAVLTPQEKDGLFGFLKELTQLGKTVIFITHKLEEVMEISDHATVMRNGGVTANLRTGDTTPEEICRYMVGREVLFEVAKRPADPGDSVLSVESVFLSDQRGVRVLEGVALEVRQGEIVGIAGVAGNGQGELIECIVGLRTPDTGAVRLRGRDLTGESVGARRAAGVAYVPEDRANVGVALAASVADNLAMGFQRDSRYSNRGFLRIGHLFDRASALASRFFIKVPDVKSPARLLSGGNLQKLVLGRELDHDAPLLVAEQPTRGLDVGASEFVHRKLIEYRDRGHAILLASADLNELMSLSDRIYVMYRGRVIGELRGTEADEYSLGMLMAGISRPDLASDAKVGRP